MKLTIKGPVELKGMNEYTKLYQMHLQSDMKLASKFSFCLYLWRWEKESEREKILSHEDIWLDIHS